MRIWKWQNNSSSMWDACHIWTLLNDLALQEYSPCSSVQGTQIFLCPKLMSCWSIHISDRMFFFFGTVKPLLGHISKLQRQPYFTNYSLVLRETRIYIISASLKQILSLSSGNFLSLCERLNDTIYLHSQSTCQEVQHICGLFPVWEVHCHLFLLPRKNTNLHIWENWKEKICSWHWHLNNVTYRLTYFIKL